MCVFSLLINISSKCPDYFEKSLLLVYVPWAASCNLINKPHFLLRTTESTLFIVLARLSAMKIIGAAIHPVIEGVFLNLYVSNIKGRKETTGGITFVSNATGI
jgi:hypothetical protein